MKRVFKIDSDSSKHYAIEAIKQISDYTKPLQMTLVAVIGIAVMILDDVMSRTKAQKIRAKERFKLPPGKFEQIDLSSRSHPDFIDRAYMNNRYVVMISDNQKIGNQTAIMAMIQRHDDKPIPNHWKEIQGIKNEIFGLEEVAVEYYPRQRHVVDYANVYWIWIFQKGVLPEYME